MVILIITHNLSFPILPELNLYFKFTLAFKAKFFKSNKRKIQDQLRKKLGRLQKALLLNKF